MANTTEIEGWRGWDEYAEFYDWENARTMGRRDLRFWRTFASSAGGPVLELGSGTGRVIAPLARTGLQVVGIDRSPEMLTRARRRVRRLGRASRVGLVRGDMTALPFDVAAFAGVLAPYGVLQSLLSDRALTATLTEVARVLREGGRFGFELVPDVPRWTETRNKLSLVGLSGPNGLPVTLFETVNQDRARRLTVFEQEFVEGLGRTRRRLRFTIRFRTVRIPSMTRRLERAGFVVDGVFGGYRDEPWSEDADTWIVMARRNG